MAKDKVVTTGKEGSIRTMHYTPKSLPETQVMQHVVFVIRCLYGAASLTLVREQRFIRIIYYYY